MSRGGVFKSLELRTRYTQRLLLMGKVFKVSLLEGSIKSLGKGFTWERLRVGRKQA